MGFIASRLSGRGQPSPAVETGQGQAGGRPGLGGPFIVNNHGQTVDPTDNEAATMPHLKKQRPDKGKLTQAKKVIASGMTEAEAIDRAKGGDAEAFEGLYGLHKRRVYSLCLRMTGNTAEAEDLTQEAFLQLYRKIATFRGESAFSTWLHRLAVNVVLMHLRKKGLPEISLDEALEPQHEDGPKKDIGARNWARTSRNWAGKWAKRSPRDRARVGKNRSWAGRLWWPGQHGWTTKQLLCRIQRNSGLKRAN